MLGVIGVIWGLTGVVLMLGYAIIRLFPVTMAAFEEPLQWYHWVCLIGFIGFMAYSEGYRGFQQAFSPRVAARLKYLYDYPRPWHVLLSPLFCMGYFYIQRRRRIAIYILTTGIIAIILAVRLLSQPWRGIIDAGVLVGLTWGLVTVLMSTQQAFSATPANPFPYAPEVPDDAPR
ncbi:hypothetical protein C2W62_15370 [Candidatus Entotheonella serta]|nr:hypothetical protein C2W62_15370 [Candidatus Entotheonella serta]